METVKVFSPQSFPILAKGTKSKPHIINIVIWYGSEPCIAWIIEQIRSWTLRDKELAFKVPNDGWLRDGIRDCSGLMIFETVCLLTASTAFKVCDYES